MSMINYWEHQAKENIDWFDKWSNVIVGDFNTLEIDWFVGAKLNVCYNCVDRHLPQHKDSMAILWQGNELNASRQITFQELHQEVSKFANLLKSHGIRKGDRVCIYLPMIPEACFAMLACARIGAIHSVVFAGFSADALKTRILDADCKIIITADGSIRGTKKINLKDSVDKAVQGCNNLEKVIVIKNTGQNINWHANRDINYNLTIQEQDTVCPAEPMLATDPLFILYTSGSTGKPKGVMHTCGGYLVYVATTFKQVFNYQAQDVYWCTADIGWITGHSYVVYGPLANAATTLIYDGIPSYPNFSRFWDIIDTYKVNQFYTSPTALRALRKEGNVYFKNNKLDSLKLLGVVGEPLNPDVWDWFYKYIGKEKCAIVNTWWQTETGGIILTPSAKTNATHGSVGLPVLGIEVDIIDDLGKSIKNTQQVGKLAIKQPWPGLMRTIFGDHKRFIDTYFSEIPGCYYPGDGAYCDKDGNIWITGRDDDVMKVSGHRIGTEEIESAFVSHPDVAEAAVVGVPHTIKGESIYAFVCLRNNVVANENLKLSLIQYIREKVGPFAMPDTIQWTVGLPKTRSGKIMRRILRKIANNDFENLGDISTLAEPNVVAEIIKDKV